MGAVYGQASEHPSNNMNENKKKFQFAECRDYSYLIGKRFPTLHANPAATVELARVLNEAE